MMRTAAKVDDNQKNIVSGLRKIGASVLIVSQLKKCFDILVGWKGRNYAFEIKDGNKTPSQRKLTGGEQKFFDEWRGQIDIILSLDDAIEKIQKK